MPFENGPYITAATFCERVIRDTSTGTISLINLVDRLTVEDQGVAPYEEGKEPVVVVVVVIDWFFVLSLRAGDMSGKDVVQLILVYPEGQRELKLGEDFELDFPEEGNVGTVLVAKLDIRMRRRGVWWVKVLLDDEVLTLVPLQVVDRSTLPEPERSRLPPWLQVDPLVSSSE